jgi:hypothetical protein
MVHYVAGEYNIDIHNFECMPRQWHTGLKQQTSALPEKK